MRAAVIVVEIILAGLSAACEDDEPPDATPRASPTSLLAAPPPAPAPAPPPDPTIEELAFIEWVITLVQNNDEPALMAATVPSFVPCAEWRGIILVGPVWCQGEPEGTSVQVSQCDGALTRLQLRMSEYPFDGPLETVFRPMIAGVPADWFEIRFFGTLHLSVRQGRIINLSRGCPSYDPLILGANVAQWVLPPQYHNVAVEALFVRANDADDEFVARVPANPANGRDYVVRSPGSDVDRRFSPGDRICVRGWREERLIVTTHFVTFAGRIPCTLAVPETGVDIIDTIIDAVHSQDMVPVISLLQTRSEPCRRDELPACGDGQPEGAGVEVFDVDLCDGGPHPVWTAFQLVANPFLERGFALYAVLDPDDRDDGEMYRVIFTQPGNGRAYWFNVSNDRILAVRSACDTDRDGEQFDGEYIVQPQHDYAPDY